MVASCKYPNSINEHFTEGRSRPELKAVGILSDLAALFVDFFRTLWGRGKQTHAFGTPTKATCLVLTSSFLSGVDIELFFSQSAFCNFVPSTVRARAQSTVTWEHKAASAIMMDRPG